MKLKDAEILWNELDKYSKDFLFCLKSDYLNLELEEWVSGKFPIFCEDGWTSFSTVFINKNPFCIDNKNLKVVYKILDYYHTNSSNMIFEDIVEQMNLCAILKNEYGDIEVSLKNIYPIFIDLGKMDLSNDNYHDIEIIWNFKSGEFNFIKK